MERLKYETLLDTILVLLNKLKNFDPHKYASLTSLLKNFKQPLTFGQIVEIGKYLETRGWAKANFTLGDVRLQITTAGILYIEKKEQAEEQLLDYMRKFNEGPISIEMFEETDDPRAKVITLVQSMIEKIREREKYEIDFIKDLEIIKIELQKLSPDYRLIEIKLSALHNLSYLADEVQELREFISAPAS
jgi:hypothetical protein